MWAKDVPAGVTGDVAGQQVPVRAKDVPAKVTGDVAGVVESAVLELADE